MLLNGAQNDAQTAPGASLRALGSVLAAWRSPGSLLERFLEPLGASWKPLGTLLKSLGALLEATWSQLGANMTGFRGPKVAKMEPKSVPNQAPTASRAEKCKIIKLEHSTKDFERFVRSRGLPFALKMSSK